MIPKRDFRLLTIDLDDTLWPCAVTIDRAESALFAWLETIVPRLTGAWDCERMRCHRRELMSSRPEIAHDVTALRWQSLRELLKAYGYDAALADDAMALFLDHRNRVEPFEDVIPTLTVLGADYQLVSVTNGNADVARTPLRGLFDLSLTAAEVGAQRPDPALFFSALEWGDALPPQALHLGDDPYLDVETARRVGMDAVWVNRSGAAWPDELDPPAAEVSGLVQLLQWLEAV